MKFYNDKSLFKKFLKDSDNYHKYYNNLLSLNNYPRMVKSPSSDSFFTTRIKYYNKNNYNSIKNNNNNYNNDLINEIFNNNINIKIDNLFVRNKKILNPIISKRKIIYNNISNLSNSPLSLKYNRNLKLLPINPTLTKNIVKSPSNISIKNKKKIKYNFKINFFKDYEKDFFNSIDYSNLKYNEYEIYNDNSLYDELVRERINYFKNIKNENETFQLEKTFYFGKRKKEINLTFNSLIITFADMNLMYTSPEKSFQIHFPFALLPIFYYKGIEAFIKFLSLVITIENTFEKIIFDECKILEALNELEEYETLVDEKEKKKDSALNYQKYEIKNSVIYLRSHFLKPKNNFLKYNYFIFFWVKNAKTYAVKITLPCIHMKILDNKLTITHFIGYELLFYLYKRNFQNWEYYIIKNLSRYNKFRNIFQKIEFITKIYDKIVFLREPKTKVNTFAEETLINIYTDQNNKNETMIFKSFYLIVKLIDTISKEESNYHIYFSFNHYVKLYEIAAYSTKISFLLQFLKINKELNSLYFNYREYDEFDVKSWMKNIKKFSKESLNKIKINEKLYEEYDLFPKKMTIEFRRPKWSIIELKDKNEIKRTWDIGYELEKELINSIIDSSSWTNLLNGCLKKIEEAASEKPRVKIKKRHKKKYNRSNTIMSIERKTSTKTNFYKS